MSYRTECYYDDVVTWYEGNKPKGKASNIEVRFEFYERMIRELLLLNQQLIKDIQRAEGRVPGDKDDTSTFPFDPNVLPRLVIPVQKAFDANGKAIA